MGRYTKADASRRKQLREARELRWAKQPEPAHPPSPGQASAASPPQRLQQLPGTAHATATSSNVFTAPAAEDATIAECISDCRRNASHESQSPPLVTTSAVAAMTSAAVPPTSAPVAGLSGLLVMSADTANSSLLPSMAPFLAASPAMTLHSVAVAAANGSLQQLYYQQPQGQQHQQHPRQLSQQQGHAALHMVAPVPCTRIPPVVVSHDPTLHSQQLQHSNNSTKAPVAKSRRLLVAENAQLAARVILDARICPEARLLGPAATAAPSPAAGPVEPSLQKSLQQHSHRLPHQLQVQHSDSATAPAHVPASPAAAAQQSVSSTTMVATVSTPPYYLRPLSPDASPDSRYGYQVAVNALQSVLTPQGRHAKPSWLPRTR